MTNSRCCRDWSYKVQGSWGLLVLDLLYLSNIISPAGVEHAEAAAVVERIAAADSPEEAARIGRGTERGQPMLLRPDWATAKLAVMYAGLRAKVCPS